MGCKYCKAIKHILENVDNRHLGIDGPILKTNEEITPIEIYNIYNLARGKGLKKIKKNKSKKAKVVAAQCGSYYVKEIPPIIG